MAVAVDANATADSTANGVTSINHANLTIGAGSNRALVVGINWAGSVSAITLRWDSAGTNQSMALITGATAINGTAEFANMWGLVAPTSGNKNLACAWTTAKDVVVNGTSWTGVDQTGGATSFPGGAGASAGSGTTASVTVTSAVGDAVQAAHTLGNTCSAVNNTQLYRDNNPANISGAGNRAAGAASVAMTATLTSAGWASAGTSIKADAGGGGRTTKNTLGFGLGMEIGMNWRGSL